MRGRAASSSRKRQVDEEAKATTTTRGLKKSTKRSKKATTTKTTMPDDPPPTSAPPPPAAAAARPSLVGPRGWIDRTELIRLLQQALSDDLGLEPVAEALAAATGVEREPAAAARLRESVSRGDWARVPALFSELGIPRESGVGRAARFVAFREAYLEALGRGDASEAVKVLRREVTPVAPDAATLRALAARLLSARKEREQGGGSGDVVGSNGTAAAAAAAASGSNNGNGLLRHRHRHPRRNDDEEIGLEDFEASAAAAAAVRYASSASFSPLLPPPPPSSPLSATFVFTPEAVACWPGPGAGSREKALEALQSLLLSVAPSSSSASSSSALASSSASGSLLPRHRLLTLLEQALAAQRSAARAHNAPPRPPLSLLADYGAAVAAAAATGRLWCGGGAGVGSGALNGAAAHGGGAGNGIGSASGVSPPPLSLAGGAAFFSPSSLSTPSASALPLGVAGGDGLPSVTTQVLLDHGDEVWHLAFSPCGTRLATGGADGVAILWQVWRDARGRRRVSKLDELHGHSGPVALLAWSPTDNGATLATAGPDGTVRLWNGRSGGDAIAVLSHHGSLVTAMAWVPGLTCSFPAGARDNPAAMYRRCSRLVTAGHDRCVHLVDAGEAIAAAGRERLRRRERRELARLNAREAAALAGEELTSSSDDEDEEEDEEALPPSTASTILRTWRGTRVNDLAVTPDGRTLLTVSSDRRVRFWDLHGGAELFRVAPAVAGGAGATASRGRGGAAGARGAAAAAARTAPASQQQQQQQPPPPLPVPVVAETESIISLSLSRAGDALLLNLSNQQLHAWRVPARHELAPLVASPADGGAGGGIASGEDLEPSEGGGGGGRGPPTTITTTTAMGATSALPAASQQQPTATNAAAAAAAAAAAPPPPPPQPIMTYRGPPTRQGRFVVRSCFGGLDDAFALSGAEDCRVYCWDRRSGELLAALDGHAGTVNAVAWNPADPGMFASASDDKSVHIWGLESDLRDEGEVEDDDDEESDDDGGNDEIDDGLRL